MSTLKERIESALKYAGITPADLSRLTGISQAAISQWRSNPNAAIKSENVFPAAEACGVSPRWLATGKKPMLESDAKNTKEARELRQLSILYTRSDARGRQSILTIAMLEASRAEPAVSEKSAETPDDVPDGYKYNSDDPKLKLKEGEAQVVGVKKKTVKKAVKKKAARTVKTKK
ncbi:MAG: helix-turn-helix transcriptional regulator [Candidatus Thiodiazotropha endolucinida]